MKQLWICAVLVSMAGLAGAAPWVVYEGGEGPGHGKNVVLISGDEEYRSEEALPQLGKILAKHHGFTCTVLFAIDPADGTIGPNVSDNIPGLEALDKADLMIIAARFRALPEDQMKHIDDYLKSGRPVMGLRTATHAFKYPDGSTSPYAHYSSNSKEWDGGFGRQVLGETWVAHHGHHAVQSTRGIVAEDQRDNPIVRGVDDIWGPTDVYTVNLPLRAGTTVLVYGQVLTGMQPTDPPVAGEYKGKTPNDPMMPVAWTGEYKLPGGKPGREFTTTMGASVDLPCEGVRRLLVNAAYWCVGMESEISAEADVSLVGDFKPSMFGFNKYTPGMKPSDFEMK